MEASCHVLSPGCPGCLVLLAGQLVNGFLLHPPLTRQHPCPRTLAAMQVLQRAQLKRQMLGPRLRPGGGQDGALDMFRWGRTGMAMVCICRWPSREPMLRPKRSMSQQCLLPQRTCCLACSHAMLC